MFKTNAMINSLKAVDEVTIISENGPNDVTAEYKGKVCKAIYNAFNGFYYVDDIYGVISDSNKIADSEETE